MDEAGHIDTSGQGKIFFGGRKLMTQFIERTFDEGGVGVTFTNSKAIDILKTYFSKKDSSVDGLFDALKSMESFKNQLEIANINPDGKFRFEKKNIDKIINSIDEIKIVFNDIYSSIQNYKITDKLHDHHGFLASAASVMREDGKFDIYFATKFIKTNLDFAFGAFHEFGHILNERGMSFSQWSKYVNSSSLFYEEISIWKNFNLPAGDPNAYNAIRIYQNLLNNQR